MCPVLASWVCKVDAPSWSLLVVVLVTAVTSVGE